MSNTRRLGSGCCADTCAVCLDFPVLACLGLLLCPCVPEGVYPWVSGITVATKATRRLIKWLLSSAARVCTPPRSSCCRGTVAPEPCSVGCPLPGSPSPKRAHIPWTTCIPPSKRQHLRQRRGPVPKPSFPGSNYVRSEVQQVGVWHSLLWHSARRRHKQIAGQPCPLPLAGIPKHCLPRGVSELADLCLDWVYVPPVHRNIKGFATHQFSRRCVALL